MTRILAIATATAVALAAMIAVPLGVTLAQGGVGRWVVTTPLTTTAPAHTHVVRTSRRQHRSAEHLRLRAVVAPKW